MHLVYHQTCGGSTGWQEASAAQPNQLHPEWRRCPARWGTHRTTSSKRARSASCTAQKRASTGSGLTKMSPSEWKPCTNSLGISSAGECAWTSAHAPARRVFAYGIHCRTEVQPGLTAESPDRLCDGRFYIIQVPKRQGAKCRLLVTARRRLPVRCPATPLCLAAVTQAIDVLASACHTRVAPPSQRSVSVTPCRILCTVRAKDLLSLCSDH